MRICYVHYCCHSCRKIPLVYSLNDYTPGKLKWSFCIGVCTNGAVVMTERLSGFSTQVKEVMSECERMHSLVHREMMDSQ